MSEEIEILSEEVTETPKKTRKKKENKFFCNIDTSIELTESQYRGYFIFTGDEALLNTNPNSKVEYREDLIKINANQWLRSKAAYESIYKAKYKDFKMVHNPNNNK